MARVISLLALVGRHHMLATIALAMCMASATLHAQTEFPFTGPTGQPATTANAIKLSEMKALSRAKADYANLVAEINRARDAEATKAAAPVPLVCNDPTQDTANATLLASVINTASPSDFIRLPVCKSPFFVGQMPSITTSPTISGGGQGGDFDTQLGTTLRFTQAAGDALSFATSGKVKLENMRLDVVSYKTGVAQSVLIQGGGTGYTVGDLLTLRLTVGTNVSEAGTCSVAPVVKVTSVASGVITGIGLQTPGVCSKAPIGEPSGVGGTGTGATFAVVWGGGAGVALSGPQAHLTAYNAPGATTLAVDNTTNITSGASVQVQLDTGAIQTVTLSAVGTNTVTLSTPLTAQASAGNFVVFAYTQSPILRDVTIYGMFDAVRADNAQSVVLDHVWAVDFAHDGYHKTSLALSDNGDDRLGGGTEFFDLNRGTSTASVEINAGFEGELTSIKYLGSAYQFYLNLMAGPTGTATVLGGSFEEARLSNVKIHQGVPGTEYGNVGVHAAEFSNLTAGGQNFQVDPGTPTTASKWVRNVAFQGNKLNDAVSTAVPLVQINDGAAISLVSNIVNNNGAGNATGMSVSGNADPTTTTISANTLTGIPAGAYGQMLQGIVAMDYFNGVPMLRVFSPGGTGGVIVGYGQGSTGMQVGVDTTSYYVNVLGGAGYRIGIGGTPVMSIDASGNLSLPALATSCSGKPSGTIYKSGSALSVC